jgi:ring-1,2-phenylacetyl-CoA epoxidase subunit PaaC
MTGLQGRRASRVLVASGVPRFDARSVAPKVREPLSELLLTLADDEFVQGFLDSEWTGIAPMLEEDVAFSSLAQDEIGHARVFYELRAALTGDDADATAFGRPADGYRHCRLLDHPRTDWAFSIVRRYLYDTADALRLMALADSSFRPLAEVVAKIRREEVYHLMHLEAWVRRLADADGEARHRLEAAVEVLWPDALSIFAPLEGEAMLVGQRILAKPMAQLAARQQERLAAAFGSLGITVPETAPEVGGGRTRERPSEGFRWLWGEFTAVHRLEEGATW